MNMVNLLKSVMGNNDMPVTFGMSKWRESGSVITPEAFARLQEVMHNDSFDNSRTSGAGRIRPSLIGDSCQRKHLLSYLGEEKLTPSDGSFDVMNAGTWGHYRWQLAGLSQGWLADIEVQVEYNPWLVKGAMDGVISDGSGWELKTVNSNKWRDVLKQNSPLFPHLMQTHAYMKALDLSHFSIVYENREHAIWKEFRVARMQEVDDTLELLMESLHNHIAIKELPVMLETCLTKKGSNYNYCDFKESCPTAQWKELA